MPPIKKAQPKTHFSQAQQPQPLNQAQPHTIQRGVVQPKTVATKGNVKHPVAPPVYRPQQRSQNIQPKALSIKQPPPGAPPVRAPQAPTVYRPQPTPRVLQRQRAGSQSQASPQPPKQLRAARPSSNIRPAQPAHVPVQPKMMSNNKRAAIPAAARQNSQAKMVTPHRPHPSGHEQQRIVQPKATTSQAARLGKSPRGNVVQPYLLEGALGVGTTLVSYEIYQQRQENAVREAYFTAQPAFTGQDGDICPFCYSDDAQDAPDTIDNSGGVVSLACNAEHRFHRGCIAQWANDQGALICPVCRANHGPWPVSVHTGYGQVADIGWGALRRFGRGIAWGFNSVGITAEGWLRAMEEGVDP